MGLRKLVELIEIDVKRCIHSHGDLPCVATGEPCYQTRNLDSDCQDIVNYEATDHTYRFAKNSGFVPYQFNALSNIRDIDFKDSKIMMAESIGTQAHISIRFFDHPTNDVRLDPYFDQRSYIAWESGSFWGKFFAINPFIHFAKLRYMRGYVGDDIADYETYNLYITHFERTQDGGATIKAVDFSRLLYEKTALCPTPSKGRLSADITDVATTCDLVPAGVGDEEYDTSGEVVIGEEAITYTRTLGSDTLTLTRGARDTEAAEHDAGEVVQIPAIFDSQTLSEIIERLVADYSELTSANFNKANADSIISLFNSALYTAYIPNPTETAKLLNELCQLACLNLYPNSQTEELEFDLITAKAAGEKLFTLGDIVQGSYQSKGVLKDRISQVVFSYGIKNPFKNIQDSGNYYAHVFNSAPENLYPTRSYKIVYCRWLLPGGFAVANITANAYLAWKQHPTTTVVFAVTPDEDVSLGEIIQVEHWTKQGCAGSKRIGVYYVIQRTPIDGGYMIVAEEYRYDPVGLTDVLDIDIPSDTLNLNLRDYFDERFTNISSYTTIRFIVRSGVRVGSSSNATYGFESGDWPDGTDIQLINNGFIVGRGGDGGDKDTDGLDGGDAMLITFPITIDNTNGVIGGGGGGGGSIEYNPGPGNTLLARGGGGAGYEGGLGSGYYALSGSTGTIPATRASTETGAEGTDFTGVVYAGDGGDLGQPGTLGQGTNATNPGDPGNAIFGDNWITWTNEGSILGARVDDPAGPPAAFITDYGQDLTGDERYSTAVHAANGKIYFIPSDATQVLIVDPVNQTGVKTDFGLSLSGSSKYFDAHEASNGKIYCVPTNATEVLIIDTSNDTAVLTNFGLTLSSTNKYNVGVLGTNDKIYCIPNREDEALIINTTNDTAVKTDFGLTLSTTTNNYRTAQLASNGKIYCAPAGVNDALIIDTSNDTAVLTDFGLTFGASSVRFETSLFAPNGKIYCPIYNAQSGALIIDTSNDTAVLNDFGLTLPSSNAHGDAVYAANGKIYCLPWLATEVLIIDTADDSAVLTDFGLTLGSQGHRYMCLGSDGKVYGSPYNDNEVLVIDTADDSGILTDFGLTLSGSSARFGNVVEANSQLYFAPALSEEVLVVNL